MPTIRTEKSDPATGAPMEGHTPGASEKKRASEQSGALFGRHFSEKEQKQLLLYLVIGIVLAELAVTVGAVIYSITNAHIGADGVPQFRFPWLGYIVALLVGPAVIMLLVHLVSLVFSRPSEGAQDMEGVPGRIRTFYALVHGAPTIILLGAVVLIGVAVYYLDGLMALLLKIGDSFQILAIWLIGGFTAAWIVSYAVRAAMHYKMRQMEAEYAFRREVLERTGMVLLDARHAPSTELRLLPGSAALPEGSPEPPVAGPDGCAAENAPTDVIDACVLPVEEKAGAASAGTPPSDAPEPTDRVDGADEAAPTRERQDKA